MYRRGISCDPCPPPQDDLVNPFPFSQHDNEVEQEEVSCIHIPTGALQSSNKGTQRREWTGANEDLKDALSVIDSIKELVHEPFTEQCSVQKDVELFLGNTELVHEPNVAPSCEQDTGGLPRSSRDEIRRSGRIGKQIYISDNQSSREETIDRNDTSEVQTSNDDICVLQTISNEPVWNSKEVYKHLKGNRKKKGRRKRASSEVLPRMEAEMDELRKRQAKLEASVLALQARVSVQASLLSDKQESPALNPLSLLKASLRQKLLVSLQKGIRLPSRQAKRNWSSSLPILEQNSKQMRGLMTQVLKISTECSMRVFEHFAMEVFNREKGGTGNRVSFYPAFHYTQNPVMESTDFDMYFQGMGGICDSLGINSVGDRLSMLLKRCKGASGLRIRILGAYVCNESEERAPVSFYVGTSCGGATAEDDANQDCPDQEKKKPVLTRRSGIYLREEQRFVSNIQLEWKRPGGLIDPCEDGFEGVERRQFGIAWRRGEEPSRRTWSAAICKPREVNGRLEVSLPCVVALGDALCGEFLDLLTGSVQLESIQ